MFWSANYIVVRELNFLLKEENVTLSQVLEAEDILQECKADNKNLMQFLTRPDILAELITLITEEPPQNVELTSQYRLASIACEVLTSDLSTLSDKLSMDVTQMNRLCDFINKPPPLNPLLASYFSKTVEMLLERSTKQDWYLYHIVCLRVLDFFKSRRDFLPNLLRHMATSAIADTFKYFIRLDDLFNKIVMEWFEEHQLLESLLAVVCGSYLPAGDEKGQRDASEKTHNHTPDEGAKECDKQAEGAAEGGGGLCARLQAVASANAAALLGDVIVCGDTRSRTQDSLVARLQSEECIRMLLQSMFTSPAHARAFAVVNGSRLLLALLSQEPVLSTGSGAERSVVELGVAPHLPLLHQALLADPRGPRPGVGLPRVQLAALAAHLALSELDEVCTTLRALGTPGVLIDMMFAYPHNNFLHAEVYTLVKHALSNRVYRTQYARHLFLECDLLTRLLDVFEENENKKPAGDSSGACGPRAAYMGHVLLMLEKVARALDYNDGELRALLPAPLLQRWDGCREGLLQLIQQRHVPLGGYYPSENIYEVENMADSLAAEYDFQDMSATATLDDIGDDLAADGLNELHMMGAGAEADDDDFINLPVVKMIQKKMSDYYECASQHRFNDDAWDDVAPRADPVDNDDADDADPTWLPWEQESGGSSADGGAGWAQFDSLAEHPPPVDPFAPADTPANSACEDEFSAFWPPAQPAADGQERQAECAEGAALSRSVQALRLQDARAASLAGHLLSAMGGLPPHQLATLGRAGGSSADIVCSMPDAPPAADAGISSTTDPSICTPADTGVSSTADGSSSVAETRSSSVADSGIVSTANTASSSVADSGIVSTTDTGSSSIADTGNSSTANPISSTAADSGSSSVTADTSSSAAPDIGCSSTTDLGSSSVGNSDMSSSDVGSSDVGSSNMGSSDMGSSDVGSSSCDS